jgi:hypothetical protein
MASRKPAQVEVPDSLAEQQNRPTAGVTVQYKTDDRNGTMDNSLMMAFLVINSMKHEGRSALPDAPIATARLATARRTGSKPGMRVRLQARLAGALHHAALAIEPVPPVVAEPRRRRPAAVETTSA